MEEDEKVGDELASFAQLKGAMEGDEIQMRIVFKKRLYFAEDVPDVQLLDAASFDLLFAQASEDIRTGRLPTIRPVVTKLAGIKLQADIGDYSGQPLEEAYMCPFASPPLRLSLLCADLSLDTCAADHTSQGTFDTSSPKRTGLRCWPRSTNSTRAVRSKRCAIATSSCSRFHSLRAYICACCLSRAGQDRLSSERFPTAALRRSSVPHGAPK